MIVNPCCVPLKIGFQFIAYFTMALAVCVGGIGIRMVLISREIVHKNESNSPEVKLEKPSLVQVQWPQVISPFHWNTILAHSYNYNHKNKNSFPFSGNSAEPGLSLELVEDITEVRETIDVGNLGTKESSFTAHSKQMDLFSPSKSREWPSHSSWRPISISTAAAGENYTTKLAEDYYYYISETFFASGVLALGIAFFQLISALLLLLGSNGFAIILIIFQSWMIKNATELHELPFKVQYIEFRNEFNFFKYKSRDFVRRLAENVIFTATEALRDDPSKTFNPEEQIKWSVQRALAVKQGDLYMKKIINIFQVIKLIPLNERIPELFQHWFKNFLLTFELPNFDEMERVCWFAGFMGLAGGSFQLVSAATLLCSIEKKDKLSAKRWIWITFGVILDYTICALIIFSQDNANWIYSSFNFYAIVSVLGLNIFALLYFLWIVLAYVQLSSASAENYIGKFV